MTCSKQLGESGHGDGMYARCFEWHLHSASLAAACSKAALQHFYLINMTTTADRPCCYYHDLALLEAITKGQARAQCDSELPSECMQQPYQPPLLSFRTATEPLHVGILTRQPPFVSRPIWLLLLNVVCSKCTVELRTCMTCAPLPTKLLRRSVTCTQIMAEEYRPQGHSREANCGPPAAVTWMHMEYPS